MFIWAAGRPGRRCLSTCIWQTVQAREGLRVGVSKGEGVGCGSKRGGGGACVWCIWIWGFVGMYVVNAGLFSMGDEYGRGNGVSTGEWCRWLRRGCVLCGVSEACLSLRDLISDILFIESFKSTQKKRGRYARMCCANLYVWVCLCSVTRLAVWAASTGSRDKLLDYFFL